MLQPRTAGAALVLFCLLGTCLVPAVAHAVGVSAPAYRWTQVNRDKPNTSYWTTDRDVARVGRVDGGLFRAFFQVDTTKINGSVVHAAGFAIPPDRSRPCTSTQVDLWAARPIDPAKPLTWKNSKNYWLGAGPVATATDNTCAGQLEFAGDALTKLVQQAADKKTGFVTVGLRADDESTSGTALKPDDLNYPTGMRIQYNNLPVVPELTTVPPGPCGTAAAPTALRSSAASHFAARVTDPDGDNVTVRLEVLGADGSVVHASEVGPVTSGSAFSWPDLPAGTLTDGPVYHYHAQARDGLDTGQSTPDCYFTVDSVAPLTPTITSTDFPPGGEPVIPARTTGTVTLHVAGGDTDVAAFLWGTNRTS